MKTDCCHPSLLGNIARNFVTRSNLSNFPVARYLQDPVQMIGPLMVTPDGAWKPKIFVTVNWHMSFLVVRCLFECYPVTNLVIHE